MYKIRPLWKGFTYFEHQVEGINWMLDKEIKGTSVPTRDGASEVLVRGGFQCDDMGLGKTMQIASVILNNPKPLTLLIAPLAMIDTWSSVLQKVGCIVYEADPKLEDPWKRMNDPEAPMPLMRMRPSVYISNYEKLYHNPSLFRNEWDRVVLDEAHKIRNGDGEVARACRKIIAPIRWAVTGTPLVNSLKDIVSLLAFIGVPHSKLWRWEPRYLRILPDLVIHRSLDSLRKVIKGAPPVPEINEVILPFTTKAEEEFYFGVQGASESLMKKYSKDLLSSAEAFKLLLRLRQISVHPQVYINAKRREDAGYSREDWDDDSTKLEKIKEIISQDDNKKVHKYIIFCQFNDEMSLIRQFLLNECIVEDENILMYNGSMTQKERGVVLAKSKETTETTVLLLQLQAGGVGLNLQEYDRIIFMSPWWTSALMDQAIARAVRMGQTEVVKVYHLRLAAEHKSAVNIDEMINAKAEEKRKMLEKLFEMCSKGGDYKQSDYKQSDYKQSDYKEDDDSSDNE
jgi:SNF2 family DNA or RNA helicase